MKISTRFFSLFCSIFTMVTLISSIWQIFNNQITDTNSHILIRALFTFIGVSVYAIFNNLKIQNKWLSLSFQYLTSLIFVFLLVWSISLLGELSSTAYRDSFLNWTAIFLVVVVLKTTITFSKR